MKRETSNRLRFILEDVVPPILRDTWLFRTLFKLSHGRHIDDLAEFRRRATFLTPEEYRAIYEVHARVHEDTDNSRACIDLVTENVVGETVCDIGCGTGYLLRHLQKQARLQACSFTGVDFVLDKSSKTQSTIEYIEANVEHLPFPDRAFDTVICTHVLEHILDIRAAVKELRRITRRRLILVVPKEREYLYTFNPHFHFFPYPHSFLRMLIPVPGSHRIDTVGRDFFYMETAAG